MLNLAPVQLELHLEATSNLNQNFQTLALTPFPSSHLELIAGDVGSEP